MSALRIVFALTLFAAACHHAPAAATGAGTVMKPAASKMPAGVTPVLIAQGDSIFNHASCMKCHGTGGVGSTNGPNLTAGKWQHGSGTYSDIISTITTGVPADQIADPSHKFNMRPRGGVQPLLTDDQVKAVAAYVYSISHH